MSDSVRPHRWQPTRLPRPWDYPGKNTGVGCHFLLQCMKVRSESEVDSSRPHGLQPTGLLRPWGFPGKSTGVGCHCLLRFLRWEQFYSPWDIWQCLEAFSVVTTRWRVLLVFRGQRLGMLLNTLKCMRQLPTTKHYLSPNINNA